MDIQEINTVIEGVRRVIRNMWEDYYPDCPFRQYEDGVQDYDLTITCRYNERINEVGENNCTFESCPQLVDLRGE